MLFNPVPSKKKKQEHNRFLFYSDLIYASTMMLATLLIGDIIIIIIFPILFFVSHGLINLGRRTLEKKFPSGKVRFVGFVIGQALHVLPVFMLTESISPSDSSRLGEILYEALAGALAPLSVDYFLRILLAYVVVLSPASVFIKHFFVMFSEKSAEEEDTAVLIGKLERLLILTLGLMGLYTAIALVFIAKTIALFKQLAERRVAERYLVGTLLSFLIAILSLVFVNYASIFALFNEFM